MNETMNTGSAQTLEPRPRLSDPATATDDISGTYRKCNSSGFEHEHIKIDGILLDDSVQYKLVLDDDLTAWASSAAMLATAVPQAVRFTRLDPPAGVSEFVYVSRCEMPQPSDFKQLVIYRFEYDTAEYDPLDEPTGTGVWLGTTSPPPPEPCV